MCERKLDPEGRVLCRLTVLVEPLRPDISVRLYKV